MPTLDTVVMRGDVLICVQIPVLVIYHCVFQYKMETWITLMCFGGSDQGKSVTRLNARLKCSCMQRITMILNPYAAGGEFGQFKMMQKNLKID